ARVRRAATRLLRRRARPRHAAAHLLGPGRAATPLHRRGGPGLRARERGLMLTGIDHLVVAVPNLDAAIDSYQDLGFHVVRGGRAQVGRDTALVPFADGAYLELIAFYEPSPAHRWWVPLQRGGGLVDYCLGSDALLEDVDRFRRAGVELVEPFPMVRTRPDGYEVRWRLSTAHEGQRGVVPFIIEDETPRAERVPAYTQHPHRLTRPG